MESEMNIGPSQSTIQAFGNNLTQTAPTAQSKVPASTQTASAPAANSTQRADAAPRPEAPVRSEPSTAGDSRDASRSPSPDQGGQRAAQIDILV
jgi:hypothetical protein